MQSSVCRSKHSHPEVRFTRRIVIGHITVTDPKQLLAADGVTVAACIARSVTAAALSAHSFIQMCTLSAVV
jgi:hypothetical protein